MKLKTKNFLFINLFMIIVFICVFIISNIFLEKYYIFQKRNKLFKTIDFFKYNEYTSTDIEEFESDGETVINIFDFIEPENEFNHLLRIGFHEKRLLLTKIWIIEDNIKKIIEAETYYQIYTQPKLKTDILIGTLNKNNKTISIALSLSNMKDTIDLFNQFYFLVFLILIIILSLIIITYSNITANKIRKISNITKKISELNFSEKIIFKSNDEFNSLALNITSLSLKLETTIKKLKSDLKLYEEINNKQKLYISNISHELKTPITILNGYAYGLKEKGKDEKKREKYTNIIIEETEKLKNLINTFFNYLSITYTTENIEKIYIKAFIKKIIEKYSLDIEQKKINLSLLIDEDQTIFFDKRMLEQIIDNFFSNAINFVNYKGKIILSAYKNKEKIRFFIYNDGNNIPEDFFEQIWEPFFRLENSRNRKYGGTGLGLSIISEIFKKYNLEYKIKNNISGISFIFFI